MGLKEKINEDLKDAMRAKDRTRLDTVRSIRASILEFEKSGKEKELNQDDEIKLLSTAAKKRKEAFEQFANAGRTDLAEKEKQELEIIQSYLPKQLSEVELLTKIKDIASQIGASKKEDFSKLMPQAMKILKGQADGNTIRSIVEKFLS